MNFTITNDSDVYDAGRALHATTGDNPKGLVVGLVVGTYFLTYEYPDTTGPNDPVAGITYDTSTGTWELRCWHTGRQLDTFTTLHETLATAISLLLETESPATVAYLEAAATFTLVLAESCKCKWSGSPWTGHTGGCPVEAHLRTLDAIKSATTATSGPDRLG